ncbi:MAG: hypothetical protein WC707_04495 [Candidatus Babeliaceae bacterium]|jgi:hypothetical protein
MKFTSKALLLTCVATLSLASLKADEPAVEAGKEAVKTVAAAAPSMFTRLVDSIKSSWTSIATTSSTKAGEVKTAVSTKASDVATSAQALIESMKKSELATKTGEFCTANSGKITGVVVVSAALIAGYAIYKTYYAEKNEKAA